MRKCCRNKNHPPLRIKSFKDLLSCKCGKGGSPQPVIVPQPPPVPLATETFNQALLPFQVEQAKALQPIILEDLIPLFKESGIPALKEQATQLATTFLPLINQIGQSATSRLNAPFGVPSELSQKTFQQATERIAPAFKTARENVGIRAAARGTLRSGTTESQLRQIDLEESEARRRTAIEQAIFEYQTSESERQTSVREAQTAAGFTPTPFQVPAPQFQSGGFINPNPSNVSWPPAQQGADIGGIIKGGAAAASFALPLLAGL